MTKIVEVTPAQFITWANSLPANTQINVWNDMKCVGAQFLKYVFPDKEICYGVRYVCIDENEMQAPEWLVQTVMHLMDHDDSVNGWVSKRTIQEAANYIKL